MKSPSPWLLIPQVIVDEIKRRVDPIGGYTLEKFQDGVCSFVKSKRLRLYSTPLYDHYAPIIDDLDKEILKRAMNDRSDNGVFLKNNKKLLDLISFYAFDKDWKDTLKKYKIAENKIEYRYGGKNGEVFSRSDTPAHNDNMLPISPILLDKSYWNIQESLPLTDKERISFLSQINSSLTLLPRIIVHGFYVKPSNNIRSNSLDSQTFNIHQFINEVEEELFLITISEGSGQGKTTFCWHLGHLFHESHNVINVPFFEKEDILQFPEIDTDKPILFLIDNCSKIPIHQFICESKKTYRGKQIIYCLFDQTIRYKDLPDWDDIAEEVNDEIFEAKLENSQNFLNKVYSLLIEILIDANPKLEISDEEFYFGRNSFINEQNVSLVDRIYSVLEFFNSLGKIKYRGFPWNVWEDITKGQPAILQDLFLLVATYFQFGVPVPIGLFSSLDQTIIIKFLSPKKGFELLDYPIILENNTNNLRLSHESIAKRFLKSQVNRNLACKLFLEHFHNHGKNPIYIYLLRNFYWLQEFKESFLLESYKHDNEFLKRCLLIFQDYFNCFEKGAIHDEILKTHTEISKILYVLDKPKAFDELNKIIDKNFEKDVHARTLLVSYYTSERGIEKKLEALRLVREVLTREPDNQSLVKKIPNLFNFLHRHYEFDQFIELKTLYNERLISLRSLLFITKILRLKFRSDYPLSEFLTFLESKPLHNSAELYAWVRLEAVRHLPFRIGVQGLSYVKCTLANIFNSNKEYGKTIRLYQFDSIEWIHNSGRILLINALILQNSLREAQQHVLRLGKSRNENYKKIAAVKQIWLYNIGKEYVELLKAINKYFERYHLDGEMILYLHRLYLDNWNDATNLEEARTELKIMITHFPNILEAWALLILLTIRQNNYIEYKQLINHIKSESTPQFKKQLCARLKKYTSKKWEGYVKYKLLNLNHEIF